MNLKISIIVSTYNAPATLARVLHGYLNQCRMPDELVVADDGSGDETRGVIERFRARAPFPVLHAWHEDEGFRLAKIRNEGVKTSCGDYLVFTDGDCIPHPRFVQDHIFHAERGYFVQGKRILVEERLMPTFELRGAVALIASAVRGELSGGHRLVRLPWLVSKSKKTRGIRGCNLAVFREDILKVNGYNEGFVGWGREDSELVERLYMLGLRRKDPLFSAMVFHLWHPLVPRDQLTDNDALLERTRGCGDYFCANGIEKGTGGVGE